jgi:protein tyrosine phosphatase (PTP) superfamily phosphohydrolase (DUF442 family)
MSSHAELEKLAQEDEKLYNTFGRVLEAEHAGEFVAIARDGRLILDSDQVRTLEKAIAEFGSGNFAFRKVGYRALGRWRTRLGH